MEGIKKPLSKALALALMMATVCFGMLAVTQTVYADEYPYYSIDGKNMLYGRDLEVEDSFQMSQPRWHDAEHPEGIPRLILNVETRDPEIVEVTYSEENGWTCTAKAEGQATLVITVSTGIEEMDTLEYTVRVLDGLTFLKDKPGDTPLYAEGNRVYPLTYAGDAAKLDIVIGEDLNNPWDNDEGDYAEYNEENEELTLHADDIWDVIGQSQDPSFELQLTLKNGGTQVDQKTFTVEVCEPYFTLSEERDWFMSVGEFREENDARVFNNENPDGEYYPITSLEEITEPGKDILRIERSENNGWNIAATEKTGETSLSVECQDEEETVVLHGEFPVKVTGYGADCQILGKQYALPGQQVKLKASVWDAENEEDVEDVDFQWSVVNGNQYIDGLAVDDNDPSLAVLTVKDSDEIDLDELPDDIDVQVEVLQGERQEQEVVARSGAWVEVTTEFYGILPESDAKDLALGSTMDVTVNKFSLGSDGKVLSEPVDSLPDGYQMECAMGEDDEEVASVQGPDEKGTCTIKRTSKQGGTVFATLLRETDGENDPEEVDFCEYDLMPLTLEGYWFDFDGVFMSESEERKAFTTAGNPVEIGVNLTWGEHILSLEKYTLKIEKENEDQTAFTKDVTNQVLREGFDLGYYRFTATANLSGQKETIEDYLTVYDRYSLEPFGPDIDFRLVDNEGKALGLEQADGPRHMRNYFRVYLKDDAFCALDKSGNLVSGSVLDQVAINGDVLRCGPDYDVRYVADEDGRGPAEEEAAFAQGKESLQKTAGYQVCLIKGVEPYTGMNGTNCILVIDESNEDLVEKADRVTDAVYDIYDGESGTLAQRVAAARAAYDSLDPDARKYLPADLEFNILAAEFKVLVDKINQDNPNEADVVKARAKYNSLPEMVRNMVVTQVPYAKLVAAEKKVADNKARADAQAAAEEAKARADAQAAAEEAKARAAAQAAEKDRQGIYDPAIPKVKAKKPVAKKSKITVKWTKLKNKKLKKSKVTKYEIWVCPNTRFAKGDTIEKIVGKGKASIKIGGLKKNTKYVVKIRAIKYVNGKKHVGPWSQKSVRTKKK